MKRFLLFIVLLIIFVISTIYIYWQYNKKGIVKNVIQRTLTDKTDSLYYIHYDSSAIDEINGNAIFYNVVLQSDTLRQNRTVRLEADLGPVQANTGRIQGSQCVFKPRRASGSLGSICCSAQACLRAGG